MTPTTWPLVAAALDAWIARVNRLQPKDRALREQLADVHAEFERIHPFLDGNGRTGRLVLNLILVRLGYPSAIIDKRQRSTYLNALRRADAPALADERIAASALRTAANRGRLQAIRGADGEWRSSRTWVDEYLESRYRRTAGTR